MKYKNYFLSYYTFLMFQSLYNEIRMWVDYFIKKQSRIDKYLDFAESELERNAKTQRLTCIQTRALFPGCRKGFHAVFQGRNILGARQHYQHHRNRQQRRQQHRPHRCPTNERHFSTNARSNTLLRTRFTRRGHRASCRGHIFLYFSYASPTRE